MKLINCWSITSNRGNLDAGDIVILYNKDGKRDFTVKRGFNWYFYCSKGAEEHLDRLIKEKLILRYTVGSKYIKVYADKKTYSSPHIKEAVNYLHNKNIQTYEADLGPAKRYLLDKDWPLEDFKNINVLYFDIETDDTSGKIEYEQVGDFTRVAAKDRILSFAGVDKKGKEYFFHNGDEKKLLEDINKFLEEEKIDMLVGWNSKDFDIPYLSGRMERHKISSSLIKNILHEDLMKRVQYFYSKDPEARQTITSYSLNSISKYFLDESKIEREGKIIDLMNSDFNTFKEYNIQDCRLVKKLEDKLGLIDLTYQMFQICQCTAQNWSMVKALDNFILAEGNRQKIHYPTNGSYIERLEDSDESQYLGAFVLDPVPGYYEKVYDLDFKSLYPNIIRTFNISPDSKMKKISGMELIETPGVEIDGVIKGKCYFDDTEQGIIPKKINLLLEERAKIRKEQKKFKKDSQEYRDLNVKQLVVKELANSIYGILGNKYFRSFSVDLAESITCTGQYLIKWLQSYFNNNGRMAIYGDTDSIFVKIKDNEEIGDVLRRCNRDLDKHLRETFNVKENSIELDLDKVFDKFLIISKKKYVGSSDGKMKYVGMECIKRDNIELANHVQKDIIAKIFNRMSAEEMEKVIIRNKKYVLDKEVPVEMITVTKKLGKDAKLYKAKKDSTKKYTPPIQVRIVKEMTKTRGDKTELSKGGSIIQFVYTNGSTDGVHISEFKGVYDRKHYWNNLIYKQIERILKVVYPETKWVEYYEYVKAIKKDGTTIRRRINSNAKGKTEDSSLS